MVFYKSSLLAAALAASASAQATTSSSEEPFVASKLNVFDIAGTSFGIPGANASYDYVIVGAGLAGSIVAERLLEMGNVSVGLIEAGNFYEITNSNYSQVPFYSVEFIGNEASQYQPVVDWDLKTAPQAGANGAEIHYTQGRCLGGSSGRNQMIYHRGTVGSHQQWADQVGDDAYLWDNFFQYYQKSFTFNEPRSNTLRAANATVSNGDGYNLTDWGTSNGPTQICFPNFGLPFSSYMDAFSAIGMEKAVDFTSGTLCGYNYHPSTIDPVTGLRSSTETGFLTQAFNNNALGKLQVYVDTMATKILMAGGNGTAVAKGVAVNSNGRDYVIGAKKEVIISAGAWHSPQLLMVSGIGPAAALQQYGIPVVSDLPGVGQNIWDSTNIGGVTYNISVPSVAAVSNPETAGEQIEMFLTNQTGFLATYGSDNQAYYQLTAADKANLSDSTNQWLDSLASDWPAFEFGLSSAAGFAENPSGENVGSISILLVGSKSRGNMTIASASIYDSPVINPNWLLEPEDLELATLAIKKARIVFEAMPTTLRAATELVPGPDVQTDEQIQTWLKANVGPIHHVSAGCAMGKVGAPATVVDSHGKVQGVQSLRVIDSSSLPFTPPGHTQGYTYALAEKLSDDIKNGL